MVDDSFYSSDSDNELEFAPFDPNCLQLAKLKSLGGEVRDSNSTEFLRNFLGIISNWIGSTPNLLDIFSRDEIELILTNTVEFSKNSIVSNFSRHPGEMICQFIARTGYKDESRVNGEGETIAHRTTALHLASRHHVSPMIAHLFEIYNSYDVNYMDEFGLTHFHIACAHGNNDIVERFIANGLHPDCIAPTESDCVNDPPLQLALSRGYRNMAELLLRSDADPNLTDKYGLTSLHVICQRAHDDDLAERFFELCRENRKVVELDARDYLGNTALHWSIARDHKKLVEFLLKSGADPNSSNADGLTPVHTICKQSSDNGMLDLFFKINGRIEKTVQINALDNLGRSPLQYAVSSISPSMIELLFNRGSDLATFVFPTKDYFGNALYRELEVLFGFHRSKLELACRVLLVIEALDSRGYKFDRSHAQTIMKFFDDFGLFEKPSHRKLRSSNKFKRVAGKIMVKSDLSLYDLTLLSPKSAEKLLTCSDYFDLVNSEKLNQLSRKIRDACSVRLCELVSNRFFLRWARDPMWELIHYRLPNLCCDKINEDLENQDLYNIFLAAADQTENPKKRKIDQSNDSFNISFDKMRKTDEIELYDKFVHSLSW